MNCAVRTLAALLGATGCLIAGCSAATPRGLADGRVSGSSVAASDLAAQVASSAGHRHARGTAAAASPDTARPTTPAASSGRNAAASSGRDVAASTGRNAVGNDAGAAAAAGHRSRPLPCSGNHGQLVLVSLRRQHMWMCAGRHLVKDTPITSGMAGPYTSTPTGRYAIQGRDRNTVLTLNTGAQYDVKYWIPFDAPLFGFHDSSWQHFPYGSPKYRKHGSHGCVHMPLRAIAFLYRWAHIGAQVRIRG